MNPGTNMSVAQRLILAFGAVLALTAMMGVMGTWQIGLMKTEFEYISVNTLPSLDVLAEESRGLEIMRQSEMQHAGRTQQEKDRAERLFDDGLNTFKKSHDLYVKTLITDDQDRDNMNVVTARLDEFLQAHRELVQLSHEAVADLGKQDAVIEHLLGSNAKAWEAVRDALKIADRYNYEIAKHSNQSANHEYSRALTMMAVGGLLALGTGLGVGFWLTRSLTTQLGGEPAAATHLAQAVARGDLSVQIDLKPGDETSVMASLKHMRDSLLRVISDVRRNADSVDLVSGQIAQGNEDLSSRTQEQAAALEETAASMEEMTATVKQTADNAKQANQLAIGVGRQGDEGSAIVIKAISAMSEISASSKRIADIIGGIDEIAFQTNLLALNAAVESARAGEQGRGFAVVASEVRNLAQRSAGAAKEIKDLINDSVHKVTTGSTLVDHVGKSLGEIVGSVKKLTGVVAEISAASQEQATGIEQVNNAVTQMDQTTQQNAALVEESAAAADDLKDRAQKLVQATAVFKLTEETTSVATQMSGASHVERRGPDRAKNVVRPNFTASEKRGMNHSLGTRSA